MVRRRGASKSARNGIGMANLLRSPLLNQIRAVPGIPQRVTLSETWYYAATGGKPAETLAAAEARAVADLARPTKTETLADFATLALATPGVPVARAKALANHHPVLPCFDAPGQTP